MDQKTGRELNSLFQKQAAPKMPHILKTAYISFENENQSCIKIECKKPFEAARWLAEILSGSSPLYERMALNNDLKEPVIFAMDAQYYEKPDGRQRIKAGIILRFKDKTSNPELHLHGHLSSGGPTAQELINTLKRAGNDWDMVDFVPSSKPGRHLKMIK